MEETWKHLFILFSISQFLLVECLDGTQSEGHTIYTGEPMNILSTVHVGIVGFEHAKSRGFDEHRL